MGFQFSRNHLKGSLAFLTISAGKKRMAIPARALGHGKMKCQFAVTVNVEAIVAIERWIIRQIGQH